MRRSLPWEKVQAGINTTFVVGPCEAESAAFILQLLKTKPPQERWAILSGRRGGLEVGACAWQQVADSTVFVEFLEGGCLCCSMAVLMQQALKQLLRRSRPQRLLIELAGPTHADKVYRMLAEPWYASLLRVNLTLVTDQGLTLQPPLPSGRLQRVESPAHARQSPHDRYTPAVTAERDRTRGKKTNPQAACKPLKACETSA